MYETFENSIQAVTVSLMMLKSLHANLHNFFPYKNPLFKFSLYIMQLTNVARLILVFFILPIGTKISFYSANITKL
jgi:hypothetical protein